MNFLEQSLDKQNQFWKYLVVFLVAMIGGNIVGGIPLACVIVAKIISGEGQNFMNFTNITDLTSFGISHNLGLFLMLIPFAVMLIFAILMIKVLHKRTFSQTVNGTPRIRLNRCFTGFIVWGAVVIVWTLVDYCINPDNFVLQFHLSSFIPLLIISIILIPIQSASEEFLFRGYLAQGVAGWTKSRWWALFIPGILFGLMHFMNPEVSEFGFWAAMPQYIFFGLLLGIIAILDDGIELPIGMHIANNLFASLLVTHKSSALQTDAVFEQLEVSINPLRDTLLYVIIGVILVCYFAKKYNWDFSILNKKVAFSENNIDHNV